MGFTVEIQGFDKLIDDVKDAGGNAKPLMNAAIVNSVNRIQSTARGLAPHAFGTLQKSIQTQVDYPEGRVSVGEKYGIDVENGTRPHAVPRSVIETSLKAWAAKRGMAGAEWAIAKKIQQRGTKAQPFFKPAIEKSADYIAEQFIKVIDRLVSGLAGRGI